MPGNDDNNNDNDNNDDDDNDNDYDYDSHCKDGHHDDDVDYMPLVSGDEGGRVRG